MDELRLVDWRRSISSWSAAVVMILLLRVDDASVVVLQELGIA